MESKNNSNEEISPAMVLANKLRENKNSLYISRVPKGTRDTFISLADEEFCSDYGMLLKFLVDKATDYDFKFLLDKIEKQDKRLDALESKEHVKPTQSTIKTLGGKIIKMEDKQ